MPPAREVERELAHVLVSPRWEDISWISVLDLFAARDADVTTELLPEHLACVGVPGEDWERLAFLRGALGPAHRPQLEEALEHTQRAGLVELLAWTCKTAKDFAAALRRAEAGKALQPAIDYASRRFVKEPAVAKRLWARAKPFVTTAAPGRGKWQTQGEQAWRALFVTDTRESAEAVAAMVAATFEYTNLPVKERLCSAAAKRARMLKHAARCAPPLVAAMTESYTDEEITHSAVAIRGAAVKARLEDKWREYTTYHMDNNPARTALGGLLAVAPRAKPYQDAAKKVLPKMLADTVIGWSDVGLINGIVMGIERGRIGALRPLLEKIARWKYAPPRFDSHGTERAVLAAELVRRRARRALDGRGALR